MWAVFQSTLGQKEAPLLEGFFRADSVMVEKRSWSCQVERVKGKKCNLLCVQSEDRKEPGRVIRNGINGFSTADEVIARQCCCASIRWLEQRWQLLWRLLARPALGCAGSRPRVLWMWTGNSTALSHSQGQFEMPARKWFLFLSFQQPAPTSTSALPCCYPGILMHSLSARVRGWDLTFHFKHHIVWTEKLQKVSNLY